MIRFVMQQHFAEYTYEASFLKYLQLVPIKGQKREMIFWPI
jgi:hypothetical protein